MLLFPRTSAAFVNCINAAAASWQPRQHCNMLLTAICYREKASDANSAAVLQGVTINAHAYNNAVYLQYTSGHACVWSITRRRRFAFTQCMPFCGSAEAITPYRMLGLDHILSACNQASITALDWAASQAPDSKPISGWRLQELAHACSRIVLRNRKLLTAFTDRPLRHHAEPDLTLHAGWQLTKYSFIYASFSVVDDQGGIHS